MYSLAEAAGAAVELLLNGKAEVTRFEGMAALESLYTRTAPKSRQGDLVAPAALLFLDTGAHHVTACKLVVIHCVHGPDCSLLHSPSQ